MKLPARMIAWMLPLLLTGCFHRSHPVQPQKLAPAVQQTPAPAPTPAPSIADTQAVPAPVEPAKTAPPLTLSPEAPHTSETPKPPVHRKKNTAPRPQVAATPSPGVSAIGQLSSGDPGIYRKQTEGMIAVAERDLRNLKRPLNSQEQRTVAHIREFLKQAHQALASGDVDGAHTLAAKAKVLLNELNR